MPLARRLSNSSHEAFTEFCIENPPLSRRLSDAAPIRSSKRRTSISNDKGQAVLKRRQSLTKARVTRSAARKHKINTSGPEAKKRRITGNRSNNPADKENAGSNNQNAGAVMMSPTPQLKVRLRCWKEGAFSIIFVIVSHYCCFCLTIDTKRLPRNEVTNFRLLWPDRLRKRKCNVRLLESQTAESFCFLHQTRPRMLEEKRWNEKEKREKGE